MKLKIQKVHRKFKRCSRDQGPVPECMLNPKAHLHFHIKGHPRPKLKQLAKVRSHQTLEIIRNLGAYSPTGRLLMYETQLQVSKKKKVHSIGKVAVERAACTPNRDR